ncbi:MAG: hypothetical protein ACR2KZ_15350 [Segetibacter sp.]
MSTKFFTNREGNTLTKKIEAVFDHNPGIKYFDALVGFVRASGYFHLRPFMDKLIHVGINVDQVLAAAQQKGLQFFANLTETKEEFIAKVLIDIDKAQYNKETEDGILQFINDIVDGRIEVRSHPSKRTM